MISPAELSPIQREAVVEEMNRILADPAFNGSKRCVILLRHIVNCAMKGDYDEFKERILGIEVFGRDPSYDSHADPIVRMTANEIRKRLGQFYFEEKDRHHSVKIHLKRGSYIPEFDFGGSGQSDTTNESEAQKDHSEPSALPHFEIQEHLAAGGDHPVLDFGGHALQPEVVENEDTEPLTKPYAVAAHIVGGKASVGLGPWMKGAAICIAVAAVCAGLILGTHLGSFRSTEYQVWRPMLEANQEIILCVSDSDLMGSSNRQGITDLRMSGEQVRNASAPLFPLVMLEDARSAHKVSNRLMQFGHRSGMDGASDLSLKNFRASSIVLIGDINNPWSMKLLSGLRYSVRMDSTTGDRWIQDSQNPANRDWREVGNIAQSGHVYAVLTRFQDAETGGLIMAMTGTGPLGTEAAADLVTAPALSNSLPNSLRTKKNFQAVLRATVVNGVIGSPQILTVYTW